MLLEFNNIAFCYDGQDQLIDKLSFTLLKNQRVGIVGHNGAGKSTVLKLAAGILQPSAGQIVGSARIGYLPQLPDFELDQTVLEFLSQEDDWVRIDALHSQSWHQTLELEQKLSSLSGGQLTKLNLARILVSQPQVLLLDEPTNHLDRESLNKLANILTGSKIQAWIMVSHDSNYLDRVCNQIWELSSSGIQVFGGNYSFYQEQKRIQAEAKAKHLEAASQNLDRVKKVHEEFQRKSSMISDGQKSAMQKGIAASESGYFRESAENKAGTKKLMIDKRLDLAASEVAQFKSEFRRPIHFLVPARLTKSKIIEITNATLRLPGGTEIITNFDLSLSGGQRVSLTGSNGSGKSALVKAIIEHLVTKGNVYKLEFQKFFTPAELNIAYLDQNYSLVNPELSLLENLDKAAPKIETEKKILQLSYFGFKIEQVYQKTGNFSGGQIAKLALAMLTLQPIDLLILDEITNNLDIATQEVITRVLANYIGSMIVISHNQSFLNSLQLEGEWRIEEQKLTTLDL